MENHARTAQYHVTLQERRSDLLGKLDTLFPSARPAEIVWELGSGHGHFLTAYAQAHPQEHCLGIDIASDRVERAVRKKERAKLPHLHFLQAEASLFLEVLPPRIKIKRTFILFPDPWPKLRHRKNRIVRADFLSALSTHTVRDGRLYFRTDFAPYFEAGRKIIAGHPAWEIVDEPWPFEFETVFQSRADAHHSLVARHRVIS